jgi:hypothetical protein
MKLSWLKAVGGFFLAALLSAPAFSANTAIPGTLNFIEGQASIQDQSLSSNSVGMAQVLPGQTIATQDGRAELLLTPGVFLRLDNNSAVKMISPSITNTKVQLEKGRAEIEVAELHKQNDLQVMLNDNTARLVKTGLYGFTASPDVVQVFKGEAHVIDGDNTIKVKGEHQLNLDQQRKLKAERFDKKTAEDDFYNWSSLRSEYLSQASANAAHVYLGNGWTGPGWYWDPWFAGYTFIPGAGFLYSPFGPWGFYSPGFIYSYGPIYRGPVIVHRPFPGHPVAGHPRPLTGFRGVPASPGFRGGHMGGFHGSGFHH